MQVNNNYLDESQEKAIKLDSNYVLVSAGAGSGKTLTILGKIDYLIKELNYKEDEILCISFTNETVNNLKQKLKDLNYQIDVYTFHKLSMKILNNSYFIISDSYLDFIIDEYLAAIVDKNKLKRILYKSDLNKLKSTIKTFINLCKCNDYNEINIYNFYNHSLFIERMILKIILDIYIIYKRELESFKALDFNDMISLATKNVVNSSINYKYIIIDEFQDTSIVRFNLIKEIINKCNAKLFVVGDDWQSIYRFSGCDLNLFLNFEKLFKNAKVYNLEYTYRNSLELIHVSSSFIMKNKLQLKKHIKSEKRLNKPIKILFNHNIIEVISLINNDNIMILGRNNYDIKNIDWKCKYTIHKSKGLEMDNIILVNSDDIPDKKNNERILRYVLKQKDYILYEEERRLFYVALTRAKENIYIMVNKNISIFVAELIKNYKNYIEIIKK